MTTKSNSFIDLPGYGMDLPELNMPSRIIRYFLFSFNYTPKDIEQMFKRIAKQYYKKEENVKYSTKSAKALLYNTSATWATFEMIAAVEGWRISAAIQVKWEINNSPNYFELLGTQQHILRSLYKGIVMQLFDTWDDYKNISREQFTRRLNYIGKMEGRNFDGAAGNFYKELVTNINEKTMSYNLFVNALYLLGIKHMTMDIDVQSECPSRPERISGFRISEPTVFLYADKKKGKISQPPP